MSIWLTEDEEIAREESISDVRRAMTRLANYTQDCALRIRIFADVVREIQAEEEVKDELD